MTRINLWSSILPLVLLTFGASGASRVERGSLIFDNIPDAPAELSDALDGYLSARQATPLGWSPKGQLLISTRFGDVEQLHLVEQAAGERRQLTFLHEPITEAEFSPDPSRAGFFFLKDVGGNENAQLRRHLAEVVKCLAYFRQNQSGIIPAIPKEQSIILQPRGIPRTSPTMNANGMTATAAMNPIVNRPA